MSNITDASAVDLVRVQKATKLVQLVIFDPLPWDDLQGHSLALQEKVNSYISFVESGQLQEMETVKIPDSPNVQILLALQYPATAGGQEFLERVKAFLAGIGMGFEVDDKPPAS